MLQPICAYGGPEDDAAKQACQACRACQSVPCKPGMPSVLMNLLSPMLINRFIGFMLRA